MEASHAAGIQNLQRRFPDLDLSVILEALETAGGHCGRAARALRALEAERSPKEAKMITPSDSRVAFPAGLGPFDLKPTSLVNLTKRHGGWTLSPSLLVGAARTVMMEQLGGALIRGSFSPEHPLTLPDEARQAIGIPKSALTFAWSYPIGQQFRLPEQHATDTDLAFFKVGGFVYFSADGSIVHVASLLTSPSGGLRFGPPESWTVEHNSTLTPAAGGMARFHPVTIPELREAGARKFCWVLPAEVPGLEHGAFAYQFGRKASAGKNVYFPVLGGDTSSSTGDISPETSALCAELALLSTLDAEVVMDAAPWDLSVNLSIIPGWDSAVHAGETVHALVSLQPPEGAACQRSSLCIVLDVSGSMGKEAVLQGKGSELERNGFSLLDIAKHAVRTVMHSMGPRDQCALVAFDSEARCVFASTLMDDDGKAEAEEKLDALTPRGGTNIWNGLQLGLDILRSTEEEGMFNHIMLLTDGKSSARDAIMPNLVEYKTKYGLPCSINTYGFGYNLDSDILVKLASYGSGTYAFIPDAGFVGTVFVNSLSNLLVTMGSDVLIDLIPSPGVKILSSTGILEASGADGSKRLSLGTLQFGQTKDVIISLAASQDCPDHGAACLVRARGHFCISGDPGKPKRIDEVEIDVSAAIGAPDDVMRVHVERCRCDLISCLAQIANCCNTGDLESARAVIQESAKTIENSPAGGTKEGQALLEDLCGQIAEAISREDWYQKWGVHYLPSLRSAHEAQQCNNFKDPSVQHYGGDLFNNVRDGADDTFNSLPPPKPSKQRPSVRPVAAERPSPPAARPVSMADYNNRFCG